MHDASSICRVKMFTAFQGRVPIKLNNLTDKNPFKPMIKTMVQVCIIQVLAFQKSWRSFSPIIVCIIAQCQCWTRGGGGGRRGGAGGTCPRPPRRGCGECPKNFFRTFICTVMFWWCLGCFRVVWGISRP